jgi:hypothetical protein
VLALLAGLLLIIAIPELSLFLPRSAGMIRCEFDSGLRGARSVPQ